MKSRVRPGAGPRIGAKTKKKSMAKAAIRARRAAFASFLQMSDREAFKQLNKYDLKRLPPAGKDAEEDSRPLIKAPEGANLQTHLEGQVRRLRLGRRETDALLWIIGRTDRRGILRFDGAGCESLEDAVERIAGALTMSRENAASCLDRARSLEPAGVCALHARDQLLLKYVREHGDRADDFVPGLLRGDSEYVSAAMIAEKLDITSEEAEEGLARLKGLIAEKLDITSEEVEEGLARLKGLGLGLDFQDDEEIVYADERILELSETPDGPVPRLVESELSNDLLEWTKEYEDILKDPSLSPEDRKAFVLAKRKLERDLNPRLRGDETIEAVASHLCKIQEEFLRGNEFAHRALTMDEVGKSLGLHRSVIQRAVTGKTLRLPSGRMVKLRELFSYRLGGGGRRRESGLSQRSALSLLLSIIAREDPANPYTDDALAGMLKGQGCPVTARTVRKYRATLKKPGCRARRRGGR